MMRFLERNTPYQPLKASDIFDKIIEFFRLKREKKIVF
jgi:hypothetical protein